MKNPPAMQEILVQFLGWEDALENSTLSLKFPQKYTYLMDLYTDTPRPNLLFPLAARPQFGGGRRAKGSDDRCSFETEEGAYLRVLHVDPRTGAIACTRLSSPAIVCCLFPTTLCARAPG